MSSSDPAGAVIRIVDRAEVASLLPSIADQIALAAKALRAVAAGRVEMPPKIGIHPRPNAFIHAMPSYLMDEDVATIKWVSGYPENPSRGLPYITGLMIVNDPATGLPQVVCDAAEITAARTAAVSGACIQAFGPPGWRTAAILGAGEQGRYHARVLRTLNPACEIHAFDPRSERAAVVCDGAVVRDDPREAAASAEIVITAGPIVDDPRPAMTPDWVAPGTLVLPLDFSFYVSAPLAAAASRLITDSLEQFAYYRSQGHFADWPDPGESTGDAIAAGRASDGTVVCANLGVGAVDAMFANAMLQHRAG